MVSANRLHTVRAMLTTMASCAMRMDGLSSISSRPPTVVMVATAMAMPARPPASRNASVSVRPCALWSRYSDTIWMP
jgi:hypothetical protein